MGKSLNKIIFVLVALAMLFLHVNTIQYIVTNDVPNTPGGNLFDQEITAHFAAQVMENATRFAWQVLNQTTDDERYVPDVVHLYISPFAGYGLEIGNDINISSTYIGSDDFKRYSSYYHTTPKFLLTSVLYHEMTHVLQWDGNDGAAPGGLIEGIADYVMVKSGFYLEQAYKEPGSGKKWDEGYGVTERFLEYCDSLTDGFFTARLNKMMRFTYNDSYFEDLLGKPVGQLWTEYKAMYGNKNDTTTSEHSYTRLIHDINY
ncbi:hypothetical protein CASFOL_009093 [Castilleja foliolosa]|uniref:Plant Basic Secretory Protein n=1 Tax=Castilleja foliolosa TaxID=1961234 RepID=A0ABD3E0V2_9LAMI